MDDRADGIPLDTTNYTYNNESQLTHIRTSSVEGNISFTISYDAAGRVSIARKLNGDGSIGKEFDFFMGRQQAILLPPHPKKPIQQSLHLMIITR